MRNTLLAIAFLASLPARGAADFTVEIEQITFGPKHHFFGYIGQCRTIPWNRSGRYIVGLRADFQDRMPGPQDAADVILIDTQAGNAVRVADRTRAWNPQQGTMLYWNPDAPETQFFFNDRDPATNKVFCVLFDTSKGSAGARVREYRFPDTPFANSGVAQNGGRFAGINYGRLARLRPVTGYPGAYDWTAGADHPDDDGIFTVATATGEKQLLVSFKQMAEALRPRHPDVAKAALFINHTLWNRDDDLLYFYVRGNWRRQGPRVNVPCVVGADGRGLKPLSHFFGGHPEWEFGHRMIGSHGGRQVIYDIDREAFVDTMGDRSVFPSPGGDIALSPDGKWFVNGYGKGGANYYVIYRRSDGAHVRTRGFDQRGWPGGDLRNDPSPCWNRDGTQILIPAITREGKTMTRQMFRLTVKTKAAPQGA
jgi:hypothetical protein